MEAGPLRDALTLLLGLVTGVLSALFGIGGAIVSNPGLRALGAAPLVAVGTTLPSILPGAVSGTLRYQRERMIAWWVVIPATAAGLPAVVGGSLLSHAVPGDGHLLLLLIAVLLAFTAWRTAIPRPSQPSNSPVADPAVTDGGGRWMAAAIGLAAGLLSGLLGIGGGVIMVPAFIDWRMAALLAVAVVPGARLGASLTIRTAERRLRLVVGVFLAVVALVYFVVETRALLEEL
jgi:uncharacterized membrane protein YfcA